MTDNGNGRHIVNNTRLGIRDAEELAEFVIHHMPMELRRRLMAERPVLYARAFPGVSPAAILGRVADGLRDAIDGQAAGRAADADAMLALASDASGLALMAYARQEAGNDTR
jgi:hypothetical protein